MPDTSPFAAAGAALNSARTAQTADRVEVTLHAGGVISHPDAENRLVTTDLQLDAAFEYDERTLVAPAANSENARSIRQYRKADARITLGDAAVVPEIRPTRRRIVVDVLRGRPTLFSPDGTLTADELDLVDIQCNSLLLERLLPQDEVEEGQIWNPPHLLWTALLKLDAIEECDVEAEATAVSDANVVVEIAGNVTGAVDGAATEVKLRARYLYDRARQRITWFALAMREERSVGHTGPALDLTAQLELKITPISTPTSLTDAALSGVGLEPSSERISLHYESLDTLHSRWSLTHPRGWIVTQDEPTGAVLRLVEDGELVAQCNLVAMRRTDPESVASIEEFRESLERMVEGRAKVVSAAERVNGMGYKEYRVIVDGQVQPKTDPLAEEIQLLPIRWVYYLVTDRYGHQAALTFTMDANLIEQFGDQDSTILDALRFDDPTDQDAADSSSATRPTVFQR